MKVYVVYDCFVETDCTLCNYPTIKIFTNKEEGREYFNQLKNKFKQEFNIDDNEINEDGTYENDELTYYEGTNTIKIEVEFDGEYVIVFEENEIDIQK